jgi:hypothetical protein
MNHGVPPGWRTVTPRVVVEDAAAFVAFLKRLAGRHSHATVGVAMVADQKEVNHGCPTLCL